MIIDDHEIVRRGIAEIVDRDDALEVVAEPGGQPPLAGTEDNEATDGTKTEEISDADEAILGLDDAPSSKDSDEQQK